MIRSGGNAGVSDAGGGEVESGGGIARARLATPNLDNCMGGHTKIDV